MSCTFRVFVYSFVCFRVLLALNHTHCARWMSVFIHSLKERLNKCPSVSQQFLNGKFTVNKSNNKFSFMAHDQAHETKQ